MDTSFERTEHGTDEWLTPPWIIKDLGPFDLDVCSPLNRPWDTARDYFTKENDGLVQKWFGRVWCNPPYGKETYKWLKKCAEHGNSIALTFARTDTKGFHDEVFGKACGLFFIKGRLKFFGVDGKEAGNNAGAPSVLIAYGADSISRLCCFSKLHNSKGKLIIF